MKKTAIAALIFAAAFTAAASEGVLYEASVTDMAGNAQSNRQVSLSVELLDTDGNIIYSEIQDATTDGSGRLSIQIGAGDATSGICDNESWINAEKMNVSITLPDGTEINDCATIGATAHAVSAATATGLVSSVSDNSRYELAVDDNGNLSTRRTEFDRLPVPEGYTFVRFHDEFDGNGLPDPRFWDYEVGNVRNGEDQYYTDARIENINIYDGVAHFTVREDEEYLRSIGEEEKLYTSASIHTRYKVGYKYGRIDVSARFPGHRGTWPAIWLMPVDDAYGIWPRSGEIDIMEQVGSDPMNVHFTVHTAQNPDGDKHHCMRPVRTCCEEFHEYSLEWTPEKLIWYIDGQLCFTMKRNSPTWVDWPFDKEFYVILNLAYGGGWGGNEGLDTEALPLTYEVDYVRIYQ